MSAAGDSDPQAVISMQIDEQSKELEILLLITGAMKETFSLYPQVLMIDAGVDCRRW